MKNKIINWVIIIIGLVLIINLIRSIIDLSKRREIVKEADLRFKEVETENALLREKYREVRREEYVEKIAREKLGLAKDNETIVVLPKKTEAEKSQEAEKEESDKKSLLNKFWELLF